MAGGVLLVIGLVPYGIGETARLVADAAGCEANAGEVHPCVLLGHDWGTTLYGMLRWFWIALLTGWLAPVGLIVMVIGLTKRRAKQTG